MFSAIDTNARLPVRPARAPNTGRGTHSCVRRLPIRPLLLANLTALLCAAPQLHAADLETAQGSGDPVVDAVNRTQLANDAALARSPAEQAARWANLMPRGFNLSLPPPSETIFPNAGGLRDKLADYGIGWFGMNVTSAANNLLSGSAKNLNGQRQYNGQTFTYVDNLYMGVTYDLAQHGIPDGQIYLSGMFTRTNWAPMGPNKFGLSEASYYQTLFNKRLEVKLGYLISTWEFINTNVGGSLSTSVFGASGSIPIQGGYSNNATPTPGIVLKYNIDKNWYAKATAERAVNPDGLTKEIHENPTSFKFTTVNSGALYIGELGYQRNSSEGVAQEWIRGGAAYNTSRYNSFETPGTRVGHNSWYYLLADRQLWQKSPAGSPGRGLYIGASVMYAPPYANAVSQYYELRLYAKGIFDSRPYDMISLVATDTVWGRDAINYYASKGSLVHRDSVAITLSYSARVMRGVYAGIGLGYVNHPTSIVYQTGTGSALNLLGNLNIFF